MGWTMPAETAVQSRIWMAFPPGGYTLGDSPEAAVSWAENELKQVYT